METCRKNFINVYQISQKRLRVVQQKLVEKIEQYGIDMRGFHNNRPNRLSEDVKMTIREHINSYPTYLSHYKRNVGDPLRPYLHHSLKISEMIRIHNPDLIISDHAYRSEFRALGLCFGSIRSDTCKKCDAFYVSELDAVDDQEILRIQAESRNHHEKSDTAYKTMYSDIEVARLNPSIIVLCVDLQQVIQNA